MPEYQTHDHDVLVIGAGGAGLRAAIEASAAGVSVGLVCKSLLGKAHTVMAEGGIAAALANVDDRDNWRNRLLGQNCIHRVIIDEVTANDLVSVHPAEIVEWVNIAGNHLRNCPRFGARECVGW